MGGGTERAAVADPPIPMAFGGAAQDRASGGADSRPQAWGRPTGRSPVTIRSRPRGAARGASRHRPATDSRLGGLPMPVIATRASREALHRLPTTVRPVVDPADVIVPQGYEVEPVLVGLSFPCGMGFADDGSLFLLEGGSTWPTRPYMPARILRLDTGSGMVGETGVEVLGGPRGVTHRDGAIHVSVKGGYHAHVDRYDLKTG